MCLQFKERKTVAKGYGFVGTILRVNLTTKDIKKEPLNKEIAQKFLGEKGLAAYYLFTETKKGVNPLGPENKLIFMTGPLTGTRAPCGNRFCVSAKSPLTGAWNDSHCGGIWGPELKWAGYDGIIIEGKAADPVYIWIEDDKVAIRDAKWFWGANTFTTERLLKEKHAGDKMARVACIGPAGERQALLANVISEVRAAGRGGLGAVMGSKNLKAIAVRGHGKPEDLIVDPVKFEEAVKVAYGKLGKGAITGPAVKGALSIMGTSNIIRGINAAGGWPTRNFQTGIFEKASEIEGQALTKYLYCPPESPGMVPCWNCPILCAHLSVVKKGPWAGFVDEGPEYENVTLLGATCGVFDREAISAAEYFCDFYGLDGISVGGTIAFLMECYQKKLITKKETDGIDLKFGNADAMVQAVMRAGAGYGKLGPLVANGSRKAAAKIGKGSAKFAINVKGLEIPAYDPRAAQGMGLAYARSDRGACHLRPWTAGAEMLGLDGIDPKETKGKAQLVKVSTDATNVAFDATGVCLFVAFGMGGDDVFNMVVPATGFQYRDFSDFVKVGERINNLTRAFNVREGLTKKDDTLPYRLLKEPLPSGPCKGQVVKLDKMLPEYYKLCGWDKTGKPTKEKLQELGLDFVIDQLYG
jgi:aldehyde:ferredoxin oxidoreductase